MGFSQVQVRLSTRKPEKLSRHFYTARMEFFADATVSSWLHPGLNALAHRCGVALS